MDFTAEDLLLLGAGYVYTSEDHTSPGVLSLRTGEPHEVLQAMAAEHSRLCARIQRLGHHNWNSRYQALTRLLPEFHNFREIAAQSWENRTAETAAREMYESWEHSPGHWKTCNGQCSIFGMSMARGANGIWYATEICADRKEN